MAQYLNDLPIIDIEAYPNENIPGLIVENAVAVPRKITIGESDEIYLFGFTGVDLNREIQKRIEQAKKR